MRQAELCEARRVKPWHVFVAGFAGMLCGGIVVWLIVRSEMHTAGNTSARITQVEADIESLRRVNGTIVSGMSSLTRSYVALPTFGEPQWQCNGASCMRIGIDECERISQARCTSQRIAWCPAGTITDSKFILGCGVTREKCELFERTARTNRACVGVE